MADIETYKLILALLMAVASGLVGSFALMRRMTLAGDAISHIALPGLAIAILFSINLVVGAGATLLIGALLIWKIESISKLNTEAVIAVLLALSLAIGEIMIKDEDQLIKLLFGSGSGIGWSDFIVGSLMSILIIIFILKKRYALTLSLISKDLAKTVGVNNERLQLSFIIIFSLTVLLGLKFLGVLLMGSLIIIPAAIARNIATNLNSMLITASLMAVTSVAMGMVFAQTFNLSLGPAIVSVAGTLFFLTLIFRKGGG